jgi:hypothetical protein
MTNQESNNFIVLLRGAISGLKRSRRSHDFVLTGAQHQQVGVTALAASVVGRSATGIGMISMAGNADEEADWVEFELDGKHVKGWLRMLPMHIEGHRQGCRGADGKQSLCRLRSQA